MSDLNINLDLLTKQGAARGLSGKDRGIAARAQFGLDVVDLQDEPVKIVAPPYLFDISSSFFLGFFGLSIKKLGEEKFRQKYKFEAAPHILKAIEHGIGRALISREPLAPSNKKDFSAAS